MQKILDETEKLAYTYLKAFGFEENEIAPVVAKGLVDLETILNKLKTVFSLPHEAKKEEVDNVLHALKGLLFHLGNHDLAEKIETLRSYDDMEKLYEVLNDLLF